MRYLDQVWRAGLCLEITCGGCGRVSVYRPLEMAQWVGRPPGSIALGALERRLVCDPGPLVRGCGHRGARIRAIPWPPQRTEPRRPRALSAAPVGVDQAAWDRADERERRKLVERARG